MSSSSAMSLSKDVERLTEDREVEFRNFLILPSDTCMNCVFLARRMSTSPTEGRCDVATFLSSSFGKTWSVNMHVHKLDSCRNCPFLSRYSEFQVECMKSVISPLCHRSAATRGGRRFRRPRRASSPDTCRNCVFQGKDGEHFTECRKLAKSALPHRALWARYTKVTTGHIRLALS